MSFTDGKSFSVTQETLDSYKRLKRRFHCSLCNHDFVFGDVCRWIYGNNTGMHNFFVCDKCDGPDALERGIASYAQAERLAKQWEIFGPDWQKELEDQIRKESDGIYYGN